MSQPEFIPETKLPLVEVHASAAGDTIAAEYEPWRFAADGTLWYRRAPIVAEVVEEDDELIFATDDDEGDTFVD